MTKKGTSQQPRADEPSAKLPEPSKEASGLADAGNKPGDEPSAKQPEPPKEVSGLADAGKKTADEPSKKLPESMEKASGIFNARKKLYTQVRERHGPVAAFAAVCLVVMVFGGLFVWWKWPELKERPYVEEVVEWFKQWTPIPTCSGQNFCVAVADLQNDSDNKFGGANLPHYNRSELHITLRALGRPAQ
jgi:hypothetical protein